MIKKYWVFAECHYYPSSGLDDVKGTFATREEAEAFIKAEYSQADYYDEIWIEDVSNQLGLLE